MMDMYSNEYNGIHIQFKYMGDINFIMSICSSILFENLDLFDWEKLIKYENTSYDFGDSHGSHNFNSINEITNIGKYIRFMLDTATGSDIKVDLPIEKCGDIFIQFNKEIQNNVLPKLNVHK